MCGLWYRCEIKLDAVHRSSMMGE